MFLDMSHKLIVNDFCRVDGKFEECAREVARPRVFNAEAVSPSSDRYREAEFSDGCG